MPDLQSHGEASGREETEKAALQLRKLRSEEIKAAADARWALRVPAFEIIKTSATLITVVVALVSLAMSQKQARAQMERLERSRREEAVGDLLRDAVGGESEQFRRAALAELSIYTGEPHLRVRIQHQLLGVVRYEKQPAVRAAITDVLLSQPDSNLIALLAAGSRAVRREITARLHKSDPGLNTTLVESVRDTVLEADSVIKDLVELEGWHAAALGRAINTLKVIHDQDFSDVAFAVYVYEVNSGEGHVYARWQANFGPGLVFRNVNFRRAVLGNAEFSGVEFDNVDLTAVRVPNAYFNRAQFRDTHGTAMLAGLDELWPRLDGDDRPVMPWFPSAGAPTVRFENSTADRSRLEFFVSEWERLLAIPNVSYQGLHNEGLRPAIAEFERSASVAASTTTAHAHWESRAESDTVLRMLDSFIVATLPRRERK